MSAIIQELHDATLPISALGIWQGLRDDDGCRALPDGPRIVWDALQMNYAAEELLAAGVATTGEDGQLQLAAPLSSPGVPLVFFRHQAEDAPFAILAGRSALGHRQSPLALALEDAFTTAAVSDTGGILFGVTTVGDLCVLRGLGLPATLVCDITEYRAEQINELRALVGDDLALPALPAPNCPPAGSAADGAADYSDALDPGGPFGTPFEDINGEATEAEATEASSAANGGPVADHSTDNDSIRDHPNGGVDLILVGCKLAEIDGAQPDGLAEVVDLLVNLETHLAVDLARVGVWLPDRADLQTVRFCASRGEVTAAREVILASVDQHTTGLTRPIDGVVGPAPLATDLIGTRAALERVLHRRDDALGDSAARRADGAELLYRAAVDRELIEPLRARAMEEGHPLRQNLDMMAAEVLRGLHYSAPRVALPGITSRAEGAVALDQYLKMAATVTRIIREARR